MENTGTISVLIVNHRARQPLDSRTLLAAQPGLSLVGEAAGELEAVRLSAELHPDVVVMRCCAVDTDSSETIRRITESGVSAGLPDPVPTAQPPRVLILADATHDECVYAALRAGAAGFLRENVASWQLATAIRTVAAGDVVISRDMTRELINVVRHRNNTAAPARECRLDGLTDRERDVLAGVAAGWSNAEIAERLFIAPTTVKSHVSSIFAKTDSHTRVQAVVFAYESGLVGAPRQRSALAAPPGASARGAGHVDEHAPDTTPGSVDRLVPEAQV